MIQCMTQINYCGICVQHAQRPVHMLQIFMSITNFDQNQELANYSTTNFWTKGHKQTNMCPDKPTILQHLCTELQLHRIQTLL